MKFRKYGQAYQLEIHSAEDLEQVLDLDESLWVATAAPAAAYRCDPIFLAAVDGDGNGRITSAEVKAAVRWLLARLRDRQGLGEEDGALPLAAIDVGRPEGRAIVESATYILDKLGASDAETITLSQIREFLNTIESRPLNGDGILVPESASDPDVAAFIRQVVACTGGTVDTGGRMGVSEAQVRDFLAAIPAYLAWRERGQASGEEAGGGVMPFGAATPAMYETLLGVEEEIDRFFDLCEWLRFESGAVVVKPAPVGEITPEVMQARLASLPLAAPNPAVLLPLDMAQINPLHRDSIARLVRTVLKPILGEALETLSREQWRQVRQALEPYAAYVAEKKGALVESLPPESLAAYRDAKFAAATAALFERDRKVAAILQNAHDVERLLLYHCHLLRLVNNFVSFPQLYDETERALFEMGSLVMDGRWFHLAVKADNPAAHSAVARQSNLFVMYLEITGGKGEKFHVAVPVTSGIRGNLAVGKRGVFFDTGGREYDARVVQVIENPVSLREALAMPFSRLWKLAEGKIESWSGAAEKDLQTEFNQTLSAPAGAGAKTTAKKQAAPESAAGRGSLFMGIGVATAALGSSFAFITKTFAAMNPLHVAGAFVGAAIMVLFPISLIAYLKLRRQDLSSLLEGAGWAVNARMRLDRSQRRTFTREAPFPEGAAGTPRRRWLRNILLVLLVVALAAALWQQCR